MERSPEEHKAVKEKLARQSLCNAAKTVKSIRLQRDYQGNGEMINLALKHSEEAMFTLASLSAEDNDERLRGILEKHDLDDLY